MAYAPYVDPVAVSLRGMAAGLASTLNSGSRLGLYAQSAFRARCGVADADAVAGRRAEADIRANVTADATPPTPTEEPKEPIWVTQARAVDELRASSLLRAEAVAEHLAVPVDTVYRLQASGEMPSRRAGYSVVRFDLAEVRRWARRPPLDHSIERNEVGETMLKAREVAERLGVSDDTVYRLTSAGEIPHYRVGVGATAPIRYDWDEVRAAFHRGRDDRSFAASPAAEPLAPR